jgi:hypothetical protein
MPVVIGEAGGSAPVWRAAVTIERRRIRLRAARRRAAQE